MSWTSDRDAQDGDANDAAAERVLAALRETAAMEGLEERVLRRVRLERLHAGREVTFLHNAQARWAVPAAVAAVALVGLILVSFRHPAEPGAPQKEEVSKFDGRSPTDAREQASGPPVKGEVRTVLSPPPPSIRLEHVGSLRVVPSRSRDEQLGNVSRTPEGRVLEASFPAPEMPLTEQERLLLEIAHRNDPVQVAMLDPVERATVLARERAQTKQFFAPRPLPAEVQHDIDVTLAAMYHSEPSAERTRP